MAKVNNLIIKLLKDGLCRLFLNERAVVIREFFAADVEGIESVAAVGAVFEQMFLLCKRLHR